MKSRIKQLTDKYLKILTPYIKRIVWLVMAGISSVSLYINSGKYAFPDKYEDKLVTKYLIGRLFFHLKHAIRGIDVYSVLLIAVFYFLFSKAPRYRGSRLEKALAALASGAVPFILTLCRSYNKKGSWAYAFGSEGAVVLTFIKILGWGFVIYALLSILSNYTFNVCSNRALKRRFVFRREAAVFAVIILVFWAPYIYLLYPGCFTPDAKDEIAQLTGTYVNSWSARSIILLDSSVLINNHHPVFYTLVLKVVLKLAAVIKSYEKAFEMLCIIQALCLAFSFSYALTVMKKYGARLRVLLLALGFFAVNPLFPIYAMTVVKDTFFCAALVLLVVMTYELLTVKRISRLRLISYFVVTLLFILTRNNGIYITALLIIFIALILLKDRKRLVKIGSALVCAALVFQLGIAGVLYPALNITPGSKREMLSVPFQQTARYVHDYREDVSPEEEKAIVAVLNGNLDEIGNSYDKELADSVKSQFNKYATDDEVKAYIKAWLTGLKKHPDAYVQAYLNLHYGWFSFCGNKQIAYSKVSDKHMDLLLDGFDKYMGKEIRRDFINYGLEGLMLNPFTAAFLETATYSWLYILLLIYAIKKKRFKALAASSAVYFNYLICFVGPVAYMRYAVPMVCALPFAAFCILKKDDEILIGENDNG